MVSASGCGPEGRGFESHISPQKKRKAPHGPGESPSVQVSKDRQQTRRPSGHLHTGRCFLPNKALRGRKKESTPRRADRKTESGCSAVGSARGLGPRCRRFESCHSDHDNGTAYKSVVPLFIFPKNLILQGFSAFFFINSSPKGASKKTHILIENALPAPFFNRYRYPYGDIRWIYGYSLTLWGNRYLYPQIVILIGGNRWLVKIHLIFL